MMPRLTRKIGHLTGDQSQLTSSSRRNTFSNKVSTYDNNASISSIKKEKYTLVRNPLRTKVSTMSNQQAKSITSGTFASTMGGTAGINPDQVLKDLKMMQKDKLIEQRKQNQLTPALPNIRK